MANSCIMIVSNNEYYISHRVEPEFDENGKFVQLNLNLMTTPNIWEAEFMKKKKILNIQTFLTKYDLLSCIVSPFGKKMLYELYDDSLTYTRKELNIYELKKVHIDPTDYKLKSGVPRLFSTTSKLLEFAIKRKRYIHSSQLEDLELSKSRFERQIHGKIFRQILRNIELSSLLEEEGENVR